MTDFRIMMSVLIRMVLVASCWSVVATPTQAQSSKPSKGARKAYAKALEAYRFLSFSLAVEHLDKAIDKALSMRKRGF